MFHARGREWIVLNGSSPDTLRLRPVSGTEEDQTLIRLALETEPVREARFPLPAASQVTSQGGAQLLRDALLLSLRRGAGPFRGFGQIAVEPRVYQLVPLLMALKQDTVRLLIADDVGVGKTIEAALIARELFDRGDIQRLTVLCPPHLVDQWVGELEQRFHLRAAAVTASSARRLESEVPQGGSLFTEHPITVVSLDYIKSDRRRDEFLRACPEFVIVDEVHTCVAGGRDRHQRFNVLRGLAEKAERHLVLLTATPHSGDESAFHQLLGLLDRDFLRLAEAVEPEREKLREKLSRHFVQRRRPDILEWNDQGGFPTRTSKEVTYSLSGAWQTFLESVLDYCADIVVAAEGDERRQRLNFWGTLALMRCVVSSPAAAAKALRTRAGLDASEEAGASIEERVFDGIGETLPDDDVELPAGSDDPKLADLIAQADALKGQSNDPKLKVLTDELAQLVKDGFQPVVFCRYIATAHYLAHHLKGRFKRLIVETVTGELTADERRQRIESLREDERSEESGCILVATDCLSEGINLQETFDAVVHYDLAWNPTRHEQREGRVDRFGQPKPVVRTTMMYGANNPVDGAVLNVILRRAAKIREELGVPVPVPEANDTLSAVLMNSLIKRRRADAPATRQLALFDEQWSRAADNAKALRKTVFAQGRLKPADVLPEWRKSLTALGGRDDVQRFTARALTQFGSGLEVAKRGHRIALGGLPADLRERFDAEGISGSIRVAFDYPAAIGYRAIQRSHPIVSVLAESLLERALAEPEVASEDRRGTLGRVGCWSSSAVKTRTTVALLRVRHQLKSIRAGQSSVLLVEEAVAVAWSGATPTGLDTSIDPLALLAVEAGEDPPEHVRNRSIAEALQLVSLRVDDLSAFAQHRAEALLADHLRVREASRARGQYAVKALLPPDVIGLFVILKAV